MERKLSAILAADVVGYSALMERDEAGTFARLKTGRKELFEPEIARRHGRVFKLMGDGLLAEFGSVVDAVECAVSLQRALAERNANLPEEERIEVRIGVNLGDILIDVPGRAVTAQSRPVDLTGIEFDLLVALARRAGRVVARDALLSAAGRDDVVVGERTVDVHISHLRQKLGDDPRSPKLIRTVRGVGYVFAKDSAE